MAEEILGIASHMDISDIDRAITEIIDNLDKIGVKTDVLSKRMSEAMREIASSTDDAATKQKRAMDVYSQAIAEVRAAMTGYPDALRQAKNEADATAQATARLESELAKMNEKLKTVKEGTDAYSQLKRNISGIEQQINSNTRAYEAQAVTIQKMEAGYNSLVQLYGVADAAVLANATAHGLTATTTTAEAGAHTKNAVEIEKETQAVKQAKEMTVEAANANEVFVSSKEEALKVVTQLVQKFHDLRDAGAASDKILAAQSEAMRAIDNYANYGLDRKDFDLSLEKSKAQAVNEQSEAINKKAQATEKAEQATEKSVKAEKTRVEELTDALAKAEEKYRNMLGLSEKSGKLSTLWAEHKVAEQVNSGVISQGELQRILEAREAVIKLKDELKEAKKEATTGNEGEQNKLVTMAHNFKEQWSYVGELKDKIRGLTQELGQCEAEYSKLAGKSNFDEDSKKVKELEEQIQRLKNQIADANQELDQMPNSAGSVLAKWKEKLVDFLTGGGKFQASLSNMKTALGGLLAPLTAATGGVMAMTRALFAMAATPIGAVLSGIVLVLQALFAWFKKSAEGQTAFAQITAYLSSLMSSLMDVAVKIGKYLFKAFTDPQTAVHAFGVNLVKMVIEPIKVIINLLQSLGSAISGVVYSMAAIKSDSWEDFHHYLDKATESFKNAERTFTAAGEAVANTIQNAYNGVINLVKSVGEVSQDVWDKTRDVDLTAYFSQQLKKAQESAQLAKQQIEAQKQLSEAKRDEKLLDIDIAKEREKIYMLTGKEKDAQIEKVKQMLKERYKPQIEAQEKLYEIQARRNKLHTASLEQLAQEREAQGAIYQLQAQQAASTRMLVRMQQANLRKMENEGKQANKKDTAVQEATTNWEETVRKNSYARAKAEEKIEQAVTDAKIAAMKDGAEKVLAEKNRAFEKELEQLDEQRKAAIEAERTRQKAEFEAQEKIIKARGGKSKQWSEDEVDKTAIDAINAQYESLKKLAVQRQQNDETQKQVQAMQDYLIQYGSMQEKRKAITEKYNKDIANAEAQGYAGEVAKLRKQLEDELASLDMQKIKNSINWEAIFNDLDKLSNAALEDLKTKLKKALNDKDITPENAKVLSEKLLEIDNRLSDNMWTSMIPALKERQRLLNEIKSSEEDIARAQKNYSNASAKQTMSQFNLQNIAQGALGRTLTKEELGYGSGTELVGKLKVVGDSAEQLKTAFDNNKIATNDLTKAQEELTAAQQQGKYLNDMLSKLTGKGSKDQNFGSALKSIFTTAAESNGGGFIGYAKLAQDNINSMAEFTDKIGLAGTDFGNAVHGFADGVNGFMSAIQSLASGDVFGAINGIIDGIAGLGKGFASIFVGNLDNHEEMVKIQKEANSQLQLINDRVAKISDKLSSSYGATAISTFEELKQYLQSSQQQYNAGLQAAGNDRYGGANSAWWHRNKNGGEGAGGYVERLKQQYGLNFQGTSWQDFFNYISTLEDGKGAKILHDLRENSSMVDIWNELMRTNSYDEGAIADWIKRWADSYDEVQKSIDTLNERLTTTTKENVFDDYLKSLYNLADGSKDVFKEIADNWQKMVNRMVVNNIVGAKQQKALEDWYENYLAKAYSDDVKIYQKNLKDAKEKYDEILKQGVDEINRLKEMGIINTTSEYQQTATGNSIQNISYDQADAIEGIMLGHTIILERTLNETVEQTGIMGNIDAGVQQIGAQVVDIREGVQVMIETQGSMNSHLAQISENTRVLPEVRDEIVRVRKLVEQQ